MLFLVPFLWGTAFLAQKLCSNVLGPFTVTTVANLLGGVFLLAVVWGRGGANLSGVRAGIICGVPFFGALLTQQIGIRYTTPGVSAFLTTTYVLLVPLMKFRTQKGKNKLLLSTIALSGVYLICMPHFGAINIGRGEAWTLLAALLFAVQILAVEHFAKCTEVLTMSCAELFTCAVLGTPFMLLASERQAIMSLNTSREIIMSIASVAYIGIVANGIACTLQNKAQAKIPSVAAAIVLSSEAVFAALAGYFVLGDTMTVPQLLGCVLVFAAAAGSKLKN